MSIRFSKSRASEPRLRSDYTGCIICTLKVHKSEGNSVVAVKAHKYAYQSQPLAVMEFIPNSASELQALQNITTFDSSNMASLLAAKITPQGEFMNIGKHGAHLYEAPNEGYMNNINEKHGKARCK
jgi:hypothetical protein